jgi:hypothetical protein
MYSNASPLPKATRNHFEKWFGADLQDVRVHLDANSALLASLLGTRAFTIGDHVFFNGQTEGFDSAVQQRLLVHELAHVVQQRKRASLSMPADECETEAESAAWAYVTGAPCPPLTADKFGVIRCDPSVHSSKIVIKHVPQVLTPTVSAGTVSFDSTIIEIEGQVEFTGSQPAAGWEAGFLQAEWVDTNWLYYRGHHEDDGSIFFQRSRPPARPVKVCRDVDPATDIYYEPSWVKKLDATSTFPTTLKIQHSDQPNDSCSVEQTNSLTGKKNYIREVQMEFHFCTVLTVRDPALKFHHQKSFYWNVHWQAVFDTHTQAVHSVKKGTSAHMGHIIDGGPNDPRFFQKLTDMTVPGCNAIMPLYDDAVMRPGHKCRREFKVWQNVDVRK